MSSQGGEGRWRGEGRRGRGGGRGGRGKGEGGEGEEGEGKGVIVHYLLLGNPIHAQEIYIVTSLDQAPSKRRGGGACNIHEKSCQLLAPGSAVQSNSRMKPHGRDI